MAVMGTDSYFVASTVIQLIVTYVEQDAILFSKPHKVSGRL